VKNRDVDCRRGEHFVEQGATPIVVHNFDEYYGIQRPGRCGTIFITTTTLPIRHTLLFPVGLSAMIWSFVKLLARSRV
jgi:hypothetical protein